MVIDAGITESDEASNAGLVSLDWGTTSLRAYLVDDSGRTLDQRSSSTLGVMAVTAGVLPGSATTSRFEDALEQICGDWLRAHPDLPIVACGMVGSDQGWVNVDYLPVPLSMVEAKLSLGVAATRFGPVHIVPGLMDVATIPDVMRGEETQILGAILAADGNGRNAASGATRLVALPGTHTKWARMSGTEIVAFTTFLTGELFALLTEHSILGRPAQRSDETDWAAFDTGVRLANQHHRKGLSGLLFSARSLMLTGRLSASGIHDYLSGLLIGSEVQGVQSWWEACDQPILLCGNPPLCQRYARALRTVNRASACIDPGVVTPRALHHIATGADLLPHNCTVKANHHG
jgi:2-dehydro-3-deoxygalactonokinase